MQLQTRAKGEQKPSFTSVHGSLKRRCTNCRKKQRLLQRRAMRQAEPAAVPPIIHEVLRSPGQPLDRKTQEFMESRFIHDFSRVRTHTAPQAVSLSIGPAGDNYEQEADRVADSIMQFSPSFGATAHPHFDFHKIQVHNDAKAAESAKAINAKAYTLGPHLVFGDRQFAPDTEAGKRLLAHELAHVVQQMDYGPSKGPSENRIRSHLIQRRIVCDEFGENCQSVPDEDFEEQTYLQEEDLFAPEDYESYASEEVVASLPEPEAEDMTEEDTSEESFEEHNYPPYSVEESVEEAIPQPLSLNKSIDPSTLTTEELEAEIDAIRRWLSAHPGNSQEQEGLRPALVSMENELISRTTTDENETDVTDQSQDDTSIEESTYPSVKCRSYSSEGVVSENLLGPYEWLGDYSNLQVYLMQRGYIFEYFDGSFDVWQNPWKCSKFFVQRAKSHADNPPENEPIEEPSEGEYPCLIKCESETENRADCDICCEGAYPDKGNCYWNCFNTCSKVFGYTSKLPDVDDPTIDYDNL